MADTEIKPGDSVTWSWGANNPSGTVEAVQPGTTSITTHRGNEVTKHGSSDDPAVKISQHDKPVVKLAHEVEIEKKGPEHGHASNANANAHAVNAHASHSGATDGHAKEKDKELEEKEKEWTHVDKGDAAQSVENGAPEKRDEPVKPASHAHTNADKGKADGAHGQHNAHDAHADKDKADGAHGHQAAPEEKKPEGANAHPEKHDKPAAKPVEKKEKPKKEPKEKKEKPKKRAWTETGEPRRSKRNKV